MTAQESDALRVLARCHRSYHGGELLDALREFQQNAEVAAALETLGPYLAGVDRKRN